jgi:hypothetical protein
MERTALEKLYIWKASRHRKPLVLEGARQVGKTWLLQEFGRQAYADTVYIDFDANPRMEQLFATDLNIDRLLLGIELYIGRKIDPANTLVIFDEVQQVPRALRALKYFCDNAPQYHIACAVSLPSVARREGETSPYPEGKVDVIRLYPMTYREFLAATAGERYAELLDRQDHAMIAAFRQTYIDVLKQYFLVGGMPEAVQSFVTRKDFNEVRSIQTRILTIYDQDFARYAPPELAPRLREVWGSVPAQLNRENKKFLYGLLHEGARAKEYEAAIRWLTDCGLVHRVNRVHEPTLPLREHEDPKAFKLYLLDVGLLGCMIGVPPRTLLDGERLFIVCNGALTEQYVCQQLESIDGFGVYYYTNERGACEMEFLLDTGHDVVPVAVKAELNLRAKSLRLYQEKFTPAHAVRTSLGEYRRQENLLDLPLYSIGQLGEAF